MQPFSGLVAFKRGEPWSIEGRAEVVLVRPASCVMPRRGPHLDRLGLHLGLDGPESAYAQAVAFKAPPPTPTPRQSRERAIISII